MKILETGQKGFTLIELLIAIGILAVIVGIAIPNLSNLLGAGKAESAASELAAVQNAVDAMMARRGITAIVNPAGTATNIMTAFPSTTNITQQLNPDFMRQTTTKYHYTCVGNGTVTQTDTPVP